MKAKKEEHPLGQTLSIFICIILLSPFYLAYIYMSNYVVSTISVKYYEYYRDRLSRKPNKTLLDEVAQQKPQPDPSSEIRKTKQREIYAQTWGMYNNPDTIKKLAIKYDDADYLSQLAKEGWNIAEISNGDPTINIALDYKAGNVAAIIEDYMVNKAYWMGFVLTVLLCIPLIGWILCLFVFISK
jgi:hypothetical protein